MISLMKSLIFCRPSAWVFREISFCILQCSFRVPQTLPWFCINSDAKTFQSDAVRSLHRFSMDSCLLQVYAGLLEIAFPLYTMLRPKHLKLLAVICENHVRFMHYCFEEPPKFIQEHLPSYDDDDDDEDETNVAQEPMDVDSAVSAVNVVNQNSTVNNSSNGNSATNSGTLASTATHCECYTKLCLSLVTLLFQLLRQWELSEKLLETSKVEQISKMSVQLLHTIFCDNYITRLFHEAEETTKHYLYLICKWWTENRNLLNFNEMHINFLHKLKSSHIMPKELSEEQNLGSITADLSDWYRKTSDNSNDINDAAIAATYTLADGERITTNLKLIDDAFDPDTFFEGLKGYAFNFQ